jgi:hypothetical protein
LSLPRNFGRNLHWAGLSLYQIPCGFKYASSELAALASLYEAGALALQQFRRSEWSWEASLDAGTLRVEICESTFYNVKVAKLEAWLKRTGGSPRDVAMRQKVRSRI